MEKQSEPIVTTIRIKRKDWLKEMPNLIKMLKINYGFYFSGEYARTQRRIQDLVKEKYSKNRHKIILYTNYEDWYLVVYTKKNTKIYWCPDYKGDSWRNIRYFEKKFRLAYEEAVRCLQERELRSFQ